jgi:ABC-type dipeptide/oligopeptide/nickel transport system permease component
MVQFMIRRTISALFVVFGVVTLVFVILRILPGDAAYLLAGSMATQEEVDAIRDQLGFSKPLYDQYWIFLKNVSHGDFGTSVFYTGSSAARLVFERLPATLELVIPSVFLAITMALGLGAIAALKRGTWIDDLMGVIALVGQAAPSFWIGPLLIIVFARNLGWLPTSGRGGWENAVLPIVTLTLPLFAVSMRLVRSGLLDILHKEYVRTARAKGLGERLVMSRHVFRNMLIPVITYIGLQLGHLLSGSVVVEVVFAWPGVGRLLVDSITNRDYAVIQVSAIVFASLFVLINLIVDLLYGVIDPRIDYS